MINITFPDGSVKQFEDGITPHQIAESISSRLAQDVLAATLNGEEWDISRPICNDGEIKLFKWDDPEGKHAFWHTSAHLLAEALQELYKGIQFGIGPAIENGFYYDIDPGENNITSADFPKIEAKMAELAAKKEDVVRKEISKAKVNGFIEKYKKFDHRDVDKAFFNEMSPATDTTRGHFSRFTPATPMIYKGYLDDESLNAIGTLNKRPLVDVVDEVIALNEGSSANGSINLKLID